MDFIYSKWQASLEEINDFLEEYDEEIGLAWADFDYDEAIANLQLLLYKIKIKMKDKKYDNIY